MYIKWYDLDHGGPNQILTNGRIWINFIFLWFFQNNEYEYRPYQKMRNIMLFDLTVYSPYTFIVNVYMHLASYPSLSHPYHDIFVIRFIPSSLSASKTCSIETKFRFSVNIVLSLSFFFNQKELKKTHRTQKILKSQKNKVIKQQFDLMSFDAIEL